ncbi:helix-turn-helix domain-containing protein [Arcanobacterium hippocoleae]|uniref:Transcriptional regulator with XRE-family HTH domain n=1 Tax=Arcanobacterium hippocoleae TaxID=149017 RepID=A0ABU1T199_9ACTO|nr:helix-turn-helix transcriptional regulator [Arcanobacterium hippocoleae]MDR6938626.1 transcriptional regulator with XRE-family HTH domain [Arcanobacterium hippocoleae]
MYTDSAIEKLVAKSLAATIVKRRKELNLSQEKVAYGASLDRSHYQVIEAGIGNRKTLTPANPRLSTLLHLAIALDCSLLDLLKETSELFERYRKAAKSMQNQA